MKLLICIASYGQKNKCYLERAIREYRRMPFCIKIVVVSDKVRQIGDDVEIRVGLPSKNPHSLPFAHKKVFSEYSDDYDFFIYSEDDILISESNIINFIRFSSILPDEYISGFLRYEVDRDGKKYCPDVMTYYHWIFNSVECYGGEIFARFSNEHAAAYMLSQKQLRSVINSGKYLVLPHKGDYDFECSASTDPYTQCGFVKVLCVSRLSEILIHHMPNAYIGREGICLDELQKQIEALLHVKNTKLEDYGLFPTRKNIPVRIWDKHLYEDIDLKLLDILNSSNKRVLSIGAGHGGLELEVKRLGHQVIAIPIDHVISASLHYRNIEVTMPNFNLAWKQLDNSVFEIIIIYNVLQHLKDPENLLNSLVKRIKSDGIFLIKISNFNHYRWRKFCSNDYATTYLNCIKVEFLVNWLKKNDFKVSVIPQGSSKVDCLLRVAGPIISSQLAWSYILVASK